MKLATTRQMQHMDKTAIESFGIPGQVLMENAGRGAFDMLLRQMGDIHSKSVCILAGRGNNGGDGFVIGRYLMEKRVPTTMILLSSRDKVQGDARHNLELVDRLCRKNASGKVIEVPDDKALEDHKNLIRHHDIYVDAILGTGLKSDVKGFLKSVIQLLNELEKPIFSVDIPSGLNADTGKPCGIAVRATATATFAFAKPGLVLYPGNEYTGRLEVIDIGIPGYIARDENLWMAVMETRQMRGLLPTRSFNAHKGNFGHLLVVAGSVGKTGAAVLCANAAMRCGTGLVTLAIPESLYHVAGPHLTEVMTDVVPDDGTGAFENRHLAVLLNQAEEKSALALGPGLGTGPETRDLVRNLIESSPVPLVLDADALNCISDMPEILKKASHQPVLTPHPGEMARLTGVSSADIQNDRAGHGRRFAQKFQSILVLKGAQTLVCHPDGSVYICPAGNPCMASGGMGDVLTGMIAGFTAQGLRQEDAAAVGVFFHGQCGDLLYEENRGPGFLASDLVKTIPRCLQEPS